jgi:hypothetical protein
MRERSWLGPSVSCAHVQYLDGVGPVTCMHECTCQADDTLPFVSGQHPIKHFNPLPFRFAGNGGGERPGGPACSLCCVHEVRMAPWLLRCQEWGEPRPRAGQTRTTAAVINRRRSSSCESLLLGMLVPAFQQLLQQLPLETTPLKQHDVLARASASMPPESHTMRLTYLA